MGVAKVYNANTAQWEAIIVGEQGFTGSVGTTGFTGSVGFTGSQGTTGFTGSVGTTGFTGSQGDTGFTGSQGVIGFTGSSGPVAGANEQVVFNDAGAANGSASFVFDKTFTKVTVNNAQIQTKLNVGNPVAFDFGSTALVELDGQQNTYVQVVIQNANTGTDASADLVVTNDGGNNTFGYVDLGINSTNYNNVNYTIVGAGDAYLYVSDTSLAIGTKAARPVIFHANGTLSTDEAMRIAPSKNVGIANNNPGDPLSVGGSTNIQGTLAAGNTTITGFANVTAGLSLSNGTSNFINWSTAGVEGPSINTRSPGTKLLLYPALSVSQTDYAMGISPATIWTTVPSNDDSFKFKWYGADIEVASLSGTGNFKVAGYANVVSTLAAGNTTITGFANVTSTLAVAGISTFSANVVLGSSGLSANGGFGTAGQVLSSNGSAAYWATASGGGGGGGTSLTTEIVTTSTVTAQKDYRYILASTSSVTLTLPSLPTLGDSLYIVVANALANNIVARNGSNIMSVAEDLTLNINDISVGLVFANTSLGWRVI